MVYGTPSSGWRLETNKCDHDLPYHIAHGRASNNLRECEIHMSREKKKKNIEEHNALRMRPLTPTLFYVLFLHTRDGKCQRRSSHSLHHTQKQSTITVITAFIINHTIGCWENAHAPWRVNNRGITYFIYKETVNKRATSIWLSLCERTKQSKQPRNETECE